MLYLKCVMCRKVDAQGPRGVSAQALAHLRAAAHAAEDIALEDKSHMTSRADPRMPCRIFSVLSGQSCSSISDVTNCMLSTSSSADSFACAQEWGASALLLLMSQENVGDAMQAKIIRAVLAALIQHADHPGVNIEGGRVLQAVLKVHSSTALIGGLNNVCMNYISMHVHVNACLQV